MLALHVPPGVSNVRVYGPATQTQDAWQTRPSTWGPRRTALRTLRSGDEPSIAGLHVVQ